MKTPDTNLSDISFTDETDHNENVAHSIKDLLPIDEGFLIRPYVGLRGQKRGYKWNLNQNGYWSLFMETPLKLYTRKNVGKCPMQYHY